MKAPQWYGTDPGIFSTPSKQSRQRFIKSFLSLMGVIVHECDWRSTVNFIVHRSLERQVWVAGMLVAQWQLVQINPYASMTKKIATPQSIAIGVSHVVFPLHKLWSLKVNVLVCDSQDTTADTVSKVVYMFPCAPLSNLALTAVGQTLMLCRPTFTVTGCAWDRYHQAWSIQM